MLKSPRSRGYHMQTPPVSEVLVPPPVKARATCPAPAGLAACMEANDPRTRIPNSAIVASFIQSPLRLELVAIRLRVAGAEGLRGKDAVTCRSKNEACRPLSTRVHA